MALLTKDKAIKTEQIYYRIRSELRKRDRCCAGYKIFDGKQIPMCAMDV